MAVAKVILNGVTQMDLTSDTIGSSTALSGYTGHGADGEMFQGTYIAPSSSGDGYEYFYGTIERNITSLTDSAFYNYSQFVSNSNYIMFGNCAYATCDSLYEVNITKPVFLSAYAFSGCNNLSSVRLTDAYYLTTHAFVSCSNLQNVFLSLQSSRITSIGEMFFYNCSSLTNCVLSGDLKGIQIIGTQAFKTCVNLSSFEILESEHVRTGAFNSYIFSIGTSAFGNCSKLETFRFKPSYDQSAYGSNAQMTKFYVAEGAFYSCWNLTTFDFPSVSDIGAGANAFAYCSSLPGNISLFSAIGTISGYAFQYCQGITSLNMPKFSWPGGNGIFAACSNLSVAILPVLSTVTNAMFQSCINLESVYIGENASTIGEIGSYAFSSCEKLTTISAPNIGTIKISAFWRCSSLAEVSFPKVSTIWNSAFTACSALSRAYFGNVLSISGADIFSLTAIRFISLGTNNSLTLTRPYLSSYTFRNLSTLETVIFNANYGDGSWPCIGIGNNTFSNDTSLFSVYLLGGSIPATLSAIGAFANTPMSGTNASGHFFVPESLYSAYISATNWATYSSRFSSLTDAQVQNVLLYGKHDP